MATIHSESTVPTCAANWFVTLITSFFSLLNRWNIIDVFLKETAHPKMKRSIRIYSPLHDFISLMEDVLQNVGTAHFHTMQVNGEWGLRLPSSKYEQKMYASIIRLVQYISSLFEPYDRSAWGKEEFSENLPFITTGYDEHHNTVKFGNNDIKSGMMCSLMPYVNICQYIFDLRATVEGNNWLQKNTYIVHDSLLFWEFKGKVYLRMKISWKFAHPQAIQTVDEFGSSL